MTLTAAEHATNLKPCEECGLPLAICNSLAYYRNAVKSYGLGRTEEAKSYAASAEQEYNMYIEAFRRNA